MEAIITDKLFTKALPSEVQYILLVKLVKYRGKNFPKKFALTNPLVKEESLKSTQ